MTNPKLLCISDLHCGSQVGLMPDNLEIEEEITGTHSVYKPNVVQDKLLTRWKQMIREVGEVDACLVNGDLCEGVQYRRRGKGLITTDLNVQADMAVSLLKKINTDKYFITEGTKYHTMEGIPLAKYIAEHLNGATYSPDMLINFYGKRIHAQHKVGVSRSVWMYRTTPLARDMLQMALSNDKEEYGPVDFVVRSHAHYFAHVEVGSMGGCITPAWQNRTIYAIRKGMVPPPEIGYVVLEVDPYDEFILKKRRWKVGPISREVEVDD